MHANNAAEREGLFGFVKNGFKYKLKFSQRREK